MNKKKDFQFHSTLKLQYILINPSKQIKYIFNMNICRFADYLTHIFTTDKFVNISNDKRSHFIIKRRFSVFECVFREFKQGVCSLRYVLEALPNRN